MFEAQDGEAGVSKAADRDTAEDRVDERCLVREQRADRVSGESLVSEPEDKQGSPKSQTVLKASAGELYPNRPDLQQSTLDPLFFTCECPLGPIASSLEHSHVLLVGCAALRPSQAPGPSARAMLQYLQSPHSLQLLDVRPPVGTSADKCCVDRG